MLDELLVAVVGEAKSKALYQAGAFVYLAKHQKPTVGRRVTRAEIRHHATATQALELKLLVGTLCIHRAGSFRDAPTSRSVLISVKEHRSGLINYP
jgi:hypothetical protein